MAKTAQQRLSDAYAALSPEKPKEEETPETERIRAGLSPVHRMSVGYARLRRENKG